MTRNLIMTKCKFHQICVLSEKLWVEWAVGYAYRRINQAFLNISLLYWLEESKYGSGYLGELVLFLLSVKQNFISFFNPTKYGVLEIHTPWKHATCTYCKTSNIRCTLVGNKIVDHSDVVGASTLLQLHLHSRLNIWLQGIRQRQPQDRARIFLSVGIWCNLY